ncbi:hypothetical protein B0H19DRAFT_957957 [Mycena capillaripes]|nr:hypothetical protein B0H19DRAFT_957957 [Mycena capillaripes]
MATCSSCPAIIPLFRSYDNSVVDHFYTANASEVVSAGNLGYSPEGIAAGIFPTQVAESTPLFRLFQVNIIDHAYTASGIDKADFEAAGYVLEMTPGFVYTTQICGSVPLYGLFHPTANDHFYTTSTSERNSATISGYTDLGIVAYVPVQGVIIQGNSC